MIVLYIRTAQIETCLLSIPELAAIQFGPTSSSDSAFARRALLYRRIQSNEE